MTTQRPDHLINEHSIDLRNLQPYGIDPEDSFPVPPQFPEPIPISSSLWRGYVATMRLCQDGRLELVRYDFPFTEPQPTQQLVHQFFTGNFAICLQPFFGGPRTWVPFRAGSLVVDLDAWDIEDQAFTGELEDLVRDDLGRVRGIRVSCQDVWYAFMPASLVPEDLLSNIESHLRQKIDCLVEEMEHVVIVRPRTLFDSRTGLHSFTRDAELAGEIYWRVDSERRDELPYSQGKFVLRDAILRRPRRASEGWWLVYQSALKEFEVHYHPDAARYRVSQGHRRELAADMKQVFALLALDPREPT